MYILSKLLFRVFSQAQKESDPNVEQRRLRKAALNSPKNMFDPITEGDPKFVKNRRKVLVRNFSNI